MLKRGVLILLIVFGFLFATKPADSEYRAMWVTRYELVDTPNLRSIVKKAAENNFNTLFVQVCGRGTSFYESKILPKDDRVPNTDALAILLDEAKKHDIEIHAWVNALYVWSKKDKPKSKKHVVNAHRDWLLGYRNKVINNKNEFLNPAIPEVRDYVKSVYMEIVNNYDVAGVHLDYIRLPNKEMAYGNSYACKDFEKKYGVDPRALLMNKRLSIKLYGKKEYDAYLEKWAQYHKNNVSTLVKEIGKEIKKVKPEVLLSAAVIADYDQAANYHFQDWAAWMKEGYLDIVIPMAYHTNEKIVQKQIAFATQLAEKYECPVLIGLGAWRLTAQNIIDHINYTRKIRENYDYPQLAGVVLFSYDRIGKEKGYLEKIKASAFSNHCKAPDFSLKKKSVVEKVLPEKDNPPIDYDDVDLNAHSIIG